MIPKPQFTSIIGPGLFQLHYRRFPVKFTTNRNPPIIIAMSLKTIHGKLHLKLKENGQEAI